MGQSSHDLGYPFECHKQGYRMGKTESKKDKASEIVKISNKMSKKQLLKLLIVIIKVKTA